MKKFFVLFFLSAASITPMELEIPQAPQDLVVGVVVRVKPEYVRGSKLFTAISQQSIETHEAELSNIAVECDVLNLIPVKEMGIYNITFRHPKSLATVLSLCSKLSGFECLYDAQKFHDDEQSYKKELYAERLRQLQKSKMVVGVALQVHPSYIIGTKVFPRVTGADLTAHQTAISQVASTYCAASISPVKDMGIYRITFNNPVSLYDVEALCAAMPGFEKIHDIESYEHEDGVLKHEIYESRLKQLDQQLLSTSLVGNDMRLKVGKTQGKEVRFLDEIVHAFEESIEPGESSSKATESQEIEGRVLEEMITELEAPHVLDRTHEVPVSGEVSARKTMSEPHIRRQANLQKLESLKKMSMNEFVSNK